jgi:hypothetical protein
VLVATLGVADGGHVRDVDDEQVEVGLDRSPAQALYRIAVVQAKFRVIDWDRPASNLDLGFPLHDDAGSTRLDYLGELGTDFWQLGRWWGDQVARKWEATVWGSLVRVRDEAERGTATGRRDRKGR